MIEGTIVSLAQKARIPSKRRAKSNFLHTCRYDWPGQKNLNLIHKQQSSTLWDIEHGNGTSYYFDREANTCRRISFPVGILTPDWLDGAEYLGQQTVDTHDCNVWKKGPRDFITYFADTQSGRPVQWIFGWDEAVFQVMTWEEGEVLEDEKWQAPDACFSSDTAQGPELSLGPSLLGRPPISLAGF